MLLCHYLQEIRLPNTAIEFLGEVSGYFLKKDILTLWSAIEYIPVSKHRSISSNKIGDGVKSLLSQ